MKILMLYSPQGNQKALSHKINNPVVISEETLKNIPRSLS